MSNEPSALTIACGIRRANGSPCQRALEALVLVDSEVRESGAFDESSDGGRSTNPVRTPRSPRHLAEMLAGSGHRQDGVIYRTGRCEDHGVVGVSEDDVRAAFAAGHAWVHAPIRMRDA